MEEKNLLESIQHQAGPVLDPEVRVRLTSFRSENMHQLMGSDKLLPGFLQEYHAWINSGVDNHITGLDSSFRKDATLAVTQSLEAFLMVHRNKRFRIAKGEYVAVQALMTPFELRWEWLENDEIRSGDALIMSAPFASSGDIHPKFYDYLESAAQANAAVLVDCAFWGICSGIELNLDYPCIETVAFSLSKCFWLGGYRIGMQYSRNPAPSIRLVNDRAYINRIGAVVACGLIRNFGPDYIPQKYKSAQRQICADLKIEPSKTVIFGLGDSSWNRFNRDCAWNRICINQILSRYLRAEGGHLGESLERSEIN